MNNKGIILIASYFIILVLLILGSAFISRSMGEARASERMKDSVQALWLAEAGLDRAIVELPTTPISGTLATGSYSTQTTQVSGSATRWLITSTGSVPDATSPNRMTKIIEAIVERPASTADPSGVTSAISANGDVVVRGSATVNGEVDEYATFNFEDIFDISKADLEAKATNLYQDPPNNVTPVSAVTWVNLVSDSEMTISDSNWTGSGILVVEGDLRITGGHFEGIIWVIGRLWVSGNPIIDGAIYVESGAEFETTLTGNPTVNFDSEVIADAFGSLPSDQPPNLVAWREL